MQSVVRNLLKNESTILLFLYKDLKPFIDIIEELQRFNMIKGLTQNKEGLTQSMRRRLFSANL